MKGTGRFKHLFFTAIVFAVFFISCNSKPNDKLTIEGRKYTISLGAVNFYNGTVVISVLADGNPMPNHAITRSSSISVGGETVSSGSSNERPVKMGLTVKGRYIFPNEMIDSSEDGEFTFYIDEMPEMIQVFTDTKVKNTVYFNANTKEVTGPPVLKQ
jgi:hypothetical protein